MLSFREQRQEFFRTIPEFWHDLYNTEYALFDIKMEDEKTVIELRQAANAVAFIFNKTASLLRSLDDETLEQLAFPKDILPFIKEKTIQWESIIGRLDFARTKEGFKLLEYNADTPTFIKETFRVNEHVCQHFGASNPNCFSEEELMEAVREAIQSATKTVKLIGSPKIVFTSHGEHEEDYLTTKYLMELAGVSAEFYSLDELRLMKEDLEEQDVLLERGLYTPGGEKINILYRQTYPLEHLINDQDPDTDEKVGEELLSLVKNKELALLNPPSAFLLQSKAVQALIWGLHEEGNSFFTKEEHAMIDEYFLPTYLDPDLFQKRAQIYVKKPSFGREGDTVQIFEGTGEVWLEDENKTYEEYLPVFQKFVELTPHQIQTEQGMKDVKIMYGCFLLNGKASAIGIRAGGQITNNTSYYLPIGIGEKEVG